MTNKPPVETHSFSLRYAVRQDDFSSALCALVTYISASEHSASSGAYRFLVVVNNTLNGELHCHSNSPFAVARPSAQDCISTIRRLPSSHIHGTFHGGSRGFDIFKLPVSKTSGLCQVSVELKAVTAEEGTWLALDLAATQLTIACADRRGYLGKRGG